jgi:pyruvate dehydrogenase E1 component
VLAALHALAEQGEVERETVRAARARYGKQAGRAASWQV